MERKTQYCQDVNSSQIDLQIQHNPEQNPRKFFCETQQTDSKVYMKRQKTQNSQNNTKEQVGQLTLSDFMIYYKVVCDSGARIDTEIGGQKALKQGMQIKCRMRHHYTSIRKDKILKTPDNKTFW